MPQRFAGPPLTREEFDATVKRVIATAPPGLSREAFEARVDQEVRRAEFAQHTSDLDREYAQVSDVPLGAWRSQLPLIGGTLAGLATGGMSVPVQLAATAMGSGLGGLLRSGTPEDALMSGAVGLASGLGGLGVVRGLQAMGPALERGGVSLVARAQKGAESALRHMPAFRRGGVRGAEQEAARTMIRERIGLTDIEKPRALIQGLNQQVEDQLAQSARMGDPRAGIQAVQEAAERYTSPETRAALESALPDFRRNVLLSQRTLTPPPSVSGSRAGRTFEEMTALKPRAPLRDVNRVKSELYRRNENAYAAANRPPGAIEGDMALARGLRGEVLRGEPTLEPVLSREAQLLGLQRVIEQTAGRLGKANPIPLGAQVVTSYGVTPPLSSPIRLGLIAANIPRVASGAGRVLARTGTNLQRAPEYEQALRAAILALLTQGGAP